jgi:septum formation topological specificity factor MinE
MAEDIQEEVTEEQVEQEATQISFGQGNDVDTSGDDAGQVESSNNSWEGDKRYEEHWAKDPNKMYESLRYHEKRQGDFDKQINDYKKQVEELSRYRDDYNAVEELFNHEQLGNELLGVINKYNNVEPEQAVQQEDPNAQRLNELLSWKSNIEEQALNSYYKQQEDAQISEIDQLASKYNLKYDKQQFIDHMNKGNIPREYWSRYFKSEALPTILEANSALSAENALKKSANAQSLATGANKQRPAVGNDSSYKSALDKILNQ